MFTEGDFFTVPAGRRRLLLRVVRVTETEITALQVERAQGGIETWPHLGVVADKLRMGSIDGNARWRYEWTPQCPVCRRYGAGAVSHDGVRGGGWRPGRHCRRCCVRWNDAARPRGIKRFESSLVEVLTDAMLALRGVPFAARCATHMAMRKAKRFH